MRESSQSHQIHWNLALRYRLIETADWWERRPTQGRLMLSIGTPR